jgi:DNA-binding phage protein
MTNEESNQQAAALLVLMLKKIAAEKGISHRELANRAGIHKSNVTRTFSLNYMPNLTTFLAIAKAIGVNFFLEDKDGTTELNVIFEQAMDELGRRPDKLPKN